MSSSPRCPPPIKLPGRSRPRLQRRCTRPTFSSASMECDRADPSQMVALRPLIKVWFKPVLTEKQPAAVIKILIDSKKLVMDGTNFLYGIQISCSQDWLPKNMTQATFSCRCADRKMQNQKPCTCVEGFWSCADTASVIPSMQCECVLEACSRKREKADSRIESSDAYQWQVVRSISHHHAGWLPAANARRQDGRIIGGRLRPIESQCQIDRTVRCWQPVRLLVFTW